MAFVGVPCRSSADVELKRPIRLFVEKTYGSATLDAVSASIEKLNDLRRGTIQRLRDRTLSAAHQIANYHDTLLLLEPRVSMSETEARIDWKWTDITGKQKKLCTSQFERANLIFCYAAMHSQIAESADTKDAAGLKQAVISLKLAAGAFDYLASNSSMFGSSGDNLVDILSTYSVVMQAQAQECVFLKAEQANMPSALVAKLASKTRELYEDGLKRCSVSSVKPHIPREWSSSLSMKAGLHAALAQYYQSKACQEAKAFGEQVARLTVAYELMKPLSRSSSFPRPGMADQIKRERDVAVKDNEFIYHEQVPAGKELSQVPTEIAIGKTELPVPLLKGEVKDLFTVLVPLGVLASKNQACAVLRSLVTAEVHRLREATDSLNAVMVSLNLPAAIQLTANEQVQSGLFENVEKIRNQGGVDQLRQHVYSLPESAERNREILNQRFAPQQNPDISMHLTKTDIRRSDPKRPTSVSPRLCACDHTPEVVDREQGSAIEINLRVGVPGMGQASLGDRIECDSPSVPTAMEEEQSPPMATVVYVESCQWAINQRFSIVLLHRGCGQNAEIVIWQQTTLDDEEKTDNNLKQQFGDRWTRQPSSKLNAQWRQDIAKMIAFLGQAAETDKMLAKRFEQDLPMFELLSKSNDEILAAIRGESAVSASSPTGNEAAREALARTCSQIESLKADRNSLTDQMNAMKLSEDFLKKLMDIYAANNQVTEQQILDLLNAELEGSRECVRASEKHQEDLLSELQINYEAYFGRQKSNNESGLATRLTAAVDTFLALDKDVKSGMQFYAELTERCLKVQQKIDDFCLARTTEKTEHLADLTTSLGRVNISEAPSAPPSTTTTTASAFLRVFVHFIVFCSGDMWRTVEQFIHFVQNFIGCLNQTYRRLTTQDYGLHPCLRRERETVTSDSRVAHLAAAVSQGYPAELSYG
ncbi:BRO1-like domain protein [Opisthorchis viverrini]|uniref:BRO1-like domain protein n=1 Tax=Opisthorchis viverrini TaxID=6198 RepID=A0A1S8X4D0_OPIVI|nr:BRO1-like domain protein [Opisthorchis viverrini]